MTNEEIELENKLQALQLTAPRLKPSDIDAVIRDVTYTMLPSGKVMVCEITLVNGFTVRGESATVSKSNFNQDIGREMSYKNARDEIWQFEGYLLQQRLYEEAKKA